MIIQLRLDVAPFAIFPKLEFVLIYTKILRNSILLSEQRDQLVVLESVEHSLPCSSLLYRKLFQTIACTPGLRLFDSAEASMLSSLTPVGLSNWNEMSW